MLSYLNKSAINSDLKSDLQALQADLSSKLSVTPTPTSSSTSAQHLSGVGSSGSGQSHRKISVGYQEERLVSNLKSSLSNADRRSILQQSKSLKTLHDDMSKRMADQPHRGSDMVQFMITNQNASNQVQAIAILNAMHEAGFIEPIDEPLIRHEDEVIAEFNESKTYKLLSLLDDDVSSVGGYSEIDMDSSLLHLRRGGGGGANQHQDDEDQQQQLKDSFGFSTSSDFETKSSLLSTAGSKSLLEAFCGHEELLLSTHKIFYINPL